MSELIQDTQIVKDLYRYAYYETRDEDKLRELLKDYAKDPNVFKAVKFLATKAEVKNTLFKCVPNADTSKFNLEPSKYPKLDTSNNPKESHFVKINDFNNISHTDKEYDNMYDFICNNVNHTSKNNKNGNCIVTIMFIVKLISHYQRDVVKVLSKYPKLINLLNTSLYHMENGVDISTDERLHIIGHMLVQLDLAKYVWVPSK